MNTCMHFMHPPKIVQIGWGHHVEFVSEKKSAITFGEGCRSMKNIDPLTDMMQADKASRCRVLSYSKYLLQWRHRSNTVLQIPCILYCFVIVFLLINRTFNLRIISPLWDNPFYAIWMLCCTRTMLGNNSARIKSNSIHPNGHNIVKPA